MLAAVTVSGMKTRPVMKKGCRPVSRVSRVTFLNTLSGRVTDSPLFRCEPSDPSTTRARLQAIGMMCRLAEAISVMTVTSHKRLVDHCVRQDMDVQLTDCRRASCRGCSAMHENARVRGRTLSRTRLDPWHRSG